MNKAIPYPAVYWYDLRISVLCTVVFGAIGLLFVGFSKAQDASSVTLAWDPSPSPGMADYYLHYGPPAEAIPS
jgi:hypothetical protein